MLAAVVIEGMARKRGLALGLLVGIDLFLSGLALAMTAIACRGLDDTSRPEAFAGRPA